jgi:NhaP-type Na+/H+ or K+/H+ antiporter
MNVLTLIIAGCLIGYLLYLLWRISSDLWKSRDNFFLVMRFALTAAFLALIGYILYQNFDLGDLLLGLLSLFLGILLLSMLLAVVERLEKNFELKKGSTKDNKTPLT